VELLPSKATFAPGEAPTVEVRGAESPLDLTLWHLDVAVASLRLPAGETLARFPSQPEGGYGVEARIAGPVRAASDAGVARTALDVLADPFTRPRYGFIADYAPERDATGVADTVRRLHLNAVQFYDWMYRHATLLTPAGTDRAGSDETFEDALGRRVSMTSVRRLVRAVHDAGSLALGYAAVYAVGREAWPGWRSEGLFHPDGTPWTLGEDFLWNVDPTSERWQAHFTSELARAVASVGFAGFHLDQYGAPKRALRSDGSLVDLAEAFPNLIARVAAALPDRHLVFNNVNDFPTWTTATAPQSATYIEVWPPHSRLAHLAALVAKARALAPRRTPILAAYLSAYRHDEAAARAAERLELATAWSHGGGVLLHGEAGAALTEAYYVRHKRLGPESLAATRRSYDFAVRYGDLLFDRDSVDVTRTELGGANEEIRVTAPATLSTDADAGTLWVRAVRGRAGLLLNLIDLTGQDDDRWDAGKRPPVMLEGVRVAVQRDRATASRFLFADPDLSPALQELPSRPEGRYDVAELPRFGAWALLWVAPPRS